MNKSLDNSRILTFGDLHFPYHHKDSLEFLSAVKDEYQPTRIINLEDTMDNHAMSFYPTNINLDNATKELKKARKLCRKLAELFPRCDCVESNHTSRLYRAGTKAGIPKELLVPYKVLLNVEESDWKWKQEVRITLPNKKHVVFIHNGGANVFLTSQRYGCSVVAGHVHSKQNIQYWNSPIGRSFAMQVGCLVDDNSPAFDYNIGQTLRKLLGCAVIIDGIPKLIEMNLNKAGNWDRRIN